MKSFLESLVSEQTKKSYERGLKKFTEYYGKNLKTFLKEKDQGKVIEKFYVWLRKKYSQNSCRALVNPIIQYCKYNDIQPRIRKSLGIYHTTLTTRDHILRVEEAREMFKIGSLEEKVLVKTWLLGLRIGDVVRLRWKKFDVEPSQELKEVLVHTRKEDIVAHCFLDSAFQRLLKKYVVNLVQSNPYLFQSKRQQHITEKQMLRRLQSLQRRARIKSQGSFNWHIGRKLFLRTCAENGVVAWNAKLMCGKQVDKSIKTYINHLDLRKDAAKIFKVLRMEESKPNGRVTNLEELTRLTAEALADLLKPIIRKKLMERGTITMASTGIIETPNIDGMSPREVLALYIELKKEGMTDAMEM